jgi:regulator of protease activity HflC (stomatin/prohibitin superfamily)
VVQIIENWRKIMETIKTIVIIGLMIFGGWFITSPDETDPTTPSATAEVTEETHQEAIDVGTHVTSSIADNSDGGVFSTVTWVLAGMLAGGIILWTIYKVLSKPASSSTDTDVDKTSVAKRTAVHPNWFYGINICIGIGVAILFMSTMDVVVLIGDPESPIRIPLLTIIFGFLLGTWLIASVAVIEPDDLGAVMCFGVPMIILGNGPKLILGGIFQLTIFPAKVHQNQYPDEPEFIQKTPDDTALEPVTITLEDGTVVERLKVRPIRIMTKAPSGKTDDILETQNAIEFTFWVRWRVSDPFEFILGSGGDLDEVVKQMRDTGESELNRQVVKLTSAQVVEKLDDIRKAMKETIETALKKQGISIEDVGLTAPDLSRTISVALQGVTVAKAEKQVQAAKAEASRYTIEQEGEARADAQKRLLEAEGAGLRAAADALGVSPEVYLAVITAQKTIGEGDVILGAEGIAQAIGLGKQILNSGKAKGGTSGT